MNFFRHSYIRHLFGATPRNPQLLWPFHSCIKLAILSSATCIGTATITVGCDREPVYEKAPSIPYKDLNPPDPSTKSGETASVGARSIDSSLSGDPRLVETCKELYTKLGATLRQNSPGVAMPNDFLTALNNARKFGMNTEENRRLGTLAELKSDTNLKVAAQIHATDLAVRGYFAHSSPEGCGLSHRVILATDYGAGRIGENIAEGQSTVPETLKDWMNSPAHRLNLLNPLYTRVGYAVTTGPENNKIWVVVFGAKDTDLPTTPARAPSMSTSPQAPASTLPLPATATSPATAPSSSTPAIPKPAAGMAPSPDNCPAGFKPETRGMSPHSYTYCLNGDQATGQITTAMRELCVKWGGGSESCLRNIWDQKMFLSARGEDKCPRGSIWIEAQKSCFQD